MPPTDTRTRPRNPWTWIPTLYFAQGLPNVLVSVVSVICYQNLGLSDGDAAYYTSLFYLPWVVKPLWSPFVEKFRTRRWWIWIMQLTGAGAFAAVALTIPTTRFLQGTIALFWFAAFVSATHDIAADGLYLMANNEHDQAFFSGVRNIAFNLAKVTAQGFLVWLVGMLYAGNMNYAAAWTIAFALAAVLLLALAVYHWVVLPKPEADVPGPATSATLVSSSHLETFADFFRKPGIGFMLAFLLLYRFGEAQLTKIAPLFLVASRDHGGLGLDDTQLGKCYGIIGVIAFVIGALLGGAAIARSGLKRWLWPMVFAIHLPDAAFVWLACSQPVSLSVISLGVAVEQFGYGFGFAAYTLYMIYIARGKHPTAHYAICTGFMALGLILPQAFSGRLSDYLGYQHFFTWVLFATIPGFIVAALIPLDREFGRRR